MAAKYLTMVGQLQWLVTLGRFDIHAQVATMSRFIAAPRQGHMDRLKRIYSYAIRTKDYAIRFRTEQPDYSFLPDQNFDWTYSVLKIPVLYSSRSPALRGSSTLLGYPVIFS